MKPGERVATFAWNAQRHYELYMAVPSFGAVLHTLNIRLFPEQVVYIVNHARDGVIFVDGSLVEPLAKLAPQFEGVRHFVVMGDGDLDALPGALSYEELLDEAGPGEYAWPEVDERAAAAFATRAAPPATRRACSTRTAPSRCTRRRSARPTPSGSPRATGAGRRAHVPRQRLGPAFRRPADGGQTGVARAAKPTGPGLTRLLREEGG